MKVLHLFANHKWTGPAELAVNVCRGLRAAAGIDARIVVGRAPRDGEDWVRDEARARGLEPVLPDVRLSKHLRLLANRRDARAVARYLEAEAVDLLHAHTPNDHWIAGGAARRAARAAGGPRPPVVRTFYDGAGPEPTLRNRFLVGRCTDAAIAASPAGRDALVSAFAFPAERAFVVEPPVDTDRFDPGRPDLPDLRLELGLAPSDFVVGIVARMQWHRRFDVFLNALARARERLPSLRAVVVGRGTNQVPVAREPARELGLGDLIRFPGYLEGDRYAGALAAFDVKVFLVPGSDGSCRAVREAMAMGKPAIVARRGMLPEIVRHGETGLVIDDSPDTLADAILSLAGDRARLGALGSAARADALRRFSIPEAARQVLTIYRTVLSPKALP